MALEGFVLRKNWSGIRIFGDDEQIDAIIASKMLSVMIGLGATGA